MSTLTEKIAEAKSLVDGDCSPMEVLDLIDDLGNCYFDMGTPMQPNREELKDYHIFGGAVMQWAWNQRPQQDWSMAFKMWFGTIPEFAKGA